MSVEMNFEIFVFYMNYWLFQYQDHGYSMFDSKVMAILNSQLILIPNSIYWVTARWRIFFSYTSQWQKYKRMSPKKCNLNKLSGHFDRTLTKDHLTKILQIWKIFTMLHIFPHISKLYLLTSASFAHVESQILARPVGRIKGSLAKICASRGKIKGLWRTDVQESHPWFFGFYWNYMVQFGKLYKMYIEILFRFHQFLLILPCGIPLLETFSSITWIESSSR